jgi:hypothetical protein
LLLRESDKLKNEARILKIGTERWTAQCNNSPADMNGNISEM